MIYGDGTVVRPIHRPGAAPGRRRDEDAEEWVGHTGGAIGSNLVTISARGPGHRQRVVLAVGRSPRPGQEAATAVEVIRHVHGLAGSGIQAVVDDGAFQGIHIHRLISELGLLVINKVASAPTPEEQPTSPDAGGSLPVAPGMFDGDE